MKTVAETDLVFIDNANTLLSGFLPEMTFPPLKPETKPGQVQTETKPSIFEVVPASIDEISRGVLIRYARYTLKRVKKLSTHEYGQHFVVNPKIIRIFVNELSKLGKPRVFEIGTGHGILTLYMSTHARQIVTFEIDRRLARIAHRLFQEKKIDNVELVIGDALAISWSRYDVVASNLPFSITSEVLVKLVREDVPRAVLTVQAEVADRLAAKPGSDQYGRLTVLVQCFYDVVRLGKFDNTSFYPEPEVNVAVVKLVRKERPLVDRKLLPVLEEVTAKLFAHRNKTIGKILRDELSVDPSALGIDEKKRVYQLTLDEIVQITCYVYEKKS